MRLFSNLSRNEGDPTIVKTGPSSLHADEQTGRALGWFSLALGTLEIAAPHLFTEPLGLEGREGWVRAFGAREIGAGMLSLSPDRPAGLWSRVAGDALDIATVLTATGPSNPKRRNARLAAVALAGVTLLDLLTAAAVTARRARGRAVQQSYADRSGFPHGVAQARGRARRPAPAQTPSQTYQVA